MAKENFIDIPKLVRSIQRAEGNPDCFQQGQEPCDQLECIWRTLCLKDQGDSGAIEPVFGGSGAGAT